MLGKVKLSGFPAWLVWLVAHIYFLINFRNRLIVMIDWGWAYLTYQRYAAHHLTECRANVPSDPNSGPYLTSIMPFIDGCSPQM